MSVLLFEKHFTLTNGMFDEHYGMKPYAYLDIFQRIAGDHADLLGIGNEYCEKHGYAWIVVRQELYMYDLIKNYIVFDKFYHFYQKHYPKYNLN